VPGGIGYSLTPRQEPTIGRVLVSLLGEDPGAALLVLTAKAESPLARAADVAVVLPQTPDSDPGGIIAMASGTSGLFHLDEGQWRTDLSVHAPDIGDEGNDAGIAANRAFGAPSKTDGGFRDVWWADVWCAARESNPQPAD
jgi:hypothetical protein